MSVLRDTHEIKQEQYDAQVQALLNAFHTTEYWNTRGMRYDPPPEQMRKEHNSRAFYPLSSNGRPSTKSITNRKKYRTWDET